MNRPNDESLEHLSGVERDCVRRYVATLVRRLSGNLAEVRLFGSAARGDMWSDRSGFRSDIDLLVLTKAELSPDIREELVNETYPLYLECGRQIGPQWRTLDQWSNPPDERSREFAQRVEEDGRTLYVAG